MKDKITITSPDTRFSFVVVGDAGDCTLPREMKEKLEYLYVMDITSPPSKWGQHMVSLDELGRYELGLSEELVEALVKVKYHKTGKKPTFTKPLENVLNTMKELGVDRIVYNSFSRTRWDNMFSRTYSTEDYLHLKILMDSYPSDMIEKIKLPIPSEIMERYGINGNVTISRRKKKQFHYLSISFPFEKRHVMPLPATFSFPVKKIGSTFYMFEEPPTREQMEEAMYVCSVYNDCKINLCVWDELVDETVEHYEKSVQNRS